MKPKHTVPPIVGEVVGKPGQMATPIPEQFERPLLDAVRKERMAVQGEIRAREHRVEKLYLIERFMETHDQADSLAEYFREMGKNEAM